MYVRETGYDGEEEEYEFYGPEDRSSNTVPRSGYVRHYMRCLDEGWTMVHGKPKNRVNDVISPPALPKQKPYSAFAPTVAVAPAASPSASFSGHH